MDGRIQFIFLYRSDDKVLGYQLATYASRLPNADGASASIPAACCGAYDSNRDTAAAVAGASAGRPALRAHSIRDNRGGRDRSTGADDRPSRRQRTAPPTPPQ